MYVCMHNYGVKSFLHNRLQLNIYIHTWSACEHEVKLLGGGITQGELISFQHYTHLDK